MRQAQDGGRDTRLDDGAAPEDSGGAAVELRNLTKRFGSVTAVDDVNLRIEAGELVSVLGASGSGKTTLLRMLAGFETSTSGRILLHGRDVSHLSPADRQVGMVFQNYALFPHLTVRQNIAYGLKMRGWSKDRRNERVDEMLRRMQLKDLDTRLPGQISGGQQQRVAIARALAYSPRLLLMDEPLGALDKALKQDLLGEIRRVHRKFSTTIVYVTHDREEALTLSDRVAIMDSGQLVTCLPVEQLYLEPPNGFVAGFFSGANVLPLGAPPVSAGSRDGDEVTVGLGDGSARLRISDDDAPGAHTADLVLAFRPSALQLTPRDGAFTLDGTVSDFVFLGDSVHLEVHVPGVERPVDCTVGRVEAGRIAPGDAIRLVLDPEDVRVVPKHRLR